MPSQDIAGNVTIDYKGRIFQGSYRLNQLIVTVNYDHRSRSMKLGDTGPEELARLMLAELVVENSGKRTLKLWLKELSRGHKS